MALAEKDSPEASRALGGLGVVVALEGRLREGEEFVRQALMVDRKVLGTESHLKSWHLLYLGDILEREGRLAEAEGLYLESLNISLKAWPDRSVALSQSLSRLNDLFLDERKFDEVERVWHRILTPQIENEPYSAVLWHARADFFARQSLWREATTAAAKAIELEPTNYDHYYSLAALRAQTGDLDGYRHCCAQILSRFSAADPPYICERMAKDCLLIPCPEIDLTAAAKLAGSAVAREEGDKYLAFFQFAQGLADYRTGNYSNAVVVLEKVAGAGRVVYREAQANAVLAMAQKRLNRTDEARAALTKGTEVFRRMAAPESGDLGGDWKDWIIANKLMEEAATVVVGGKEMLLESELIGPLNGLAWRLATCPESKGRNGALAVTLARRAVEASDRKDPGILDTLAAAHAEAGNFAEAISIQKEALVIETNRDLRAQYTARQALYETNTPYREAGQDAALLPAVGSLSDVLVAQKKYADAEMVWHEILTSQLENEPSSAVLWHARADFFGRRSLWREATTAAAKAVELEPTNHDHYQMVAALLAQTGDLEGYRRCCGQILSRFSAADPPNVCERMAKDCLFVQCPGVDLAGAAKLADSAVARGQGNGYFEFFQFAQGLADYRTGDWSNAVTVLEKVTEAKGIAFRDAQANAVLAMAQKRLNHIEEARAALASGTEVFRRMAAPESGDLGGDWKDWIIANALLKEAKGLIEDQPLPASGQSSPPSVSSKRN